LTTKEASAAIRERRAAPRELRAGDPRVWWFEAAELDFIRDEILPSLDVRPSDAALIARADAPDVGGAYGGNLDSRARMRGCHGLLGAIAGIDPRVWRDLAA